MSAPFFSLIGDAASEVWTYPRGHVRRMAVITAPARNVHLSWEGTSRTRRGPRRCFVSSNVYNEVRQKFECHEHGRNFRTSSRCLVEEEEGLCLVSLFGCSHYNKLIVAFELRACFAFILWQQSGIIVGRVSPSAAFSATESPLALSAQFRIS